MAVRTRSHLRVVPDARRAQLLPNAVFGTLIFVIAEAMLFAGFISAFVIVRSGASVWPPPGQPRLPVEETAFNTLALLASGALLFAAGRAFPDSRRSAGRRLLGAIALGSFFVVFQGVEWVALIREGLTLTSSPHGSFFYLIVGMHALHAVAALVVLAGVYAGLRRGPLRPSAFAAARVFWYFVVGLWPILYLRVYL